MWEMYVCTVRRDKNMPRAMSDVESPLATSAAILTSVGVSASQPEVARGPRAAPDASLDAVRAQPGFGPPDIPSGLHLLVQANGFVQGGPRIVVMAAPGQHDSQVFQRGGQFHCRADRPVVCRSLRERVRIRLKQSATPQAGRCGAGRPGLRCGLFRTGVRRGPRQLPVPRGER